MQAILSGAAWRHLQAIAANGHIDQRADDELARHGLVTRGTGRRLSLSTSATALLAAFLSPTATLRLQGVAGPEAREADLWVAADGSGLEVLTRGDVVRLHTIDAGLVPTRVAALIALQPRPVAEPSTPSTIKTDLALDLFEGVAEPAQLRQEIAWLWPDIASEIVAGQISLWSVQAYAWQGAQPVSAGVLCFLDSAAGCIHFELGPGFATLTTQPTAVIWHRLTVLFAAAGIGR